MKNSKRALRIIREARSVVVAGHLHPDGDSIGALLSLGLGIAKLGKKVYMVSRDGVPKMYRSLPGASRIVKKVDRECDVAIAVDCDSAEMLGKGVDFYKLTDMVYWNKTRASLILSSLCLLRSVFLVKGRVVWSIIRKRDFAQAHGTHEDADAIADEMRAIKGVKVAVLFREKNARVLRVSLRSKESVNIAALAEQHGGGGHFDAAGCVIPNSKKAIGQFLKDARDSVR